MTESTTIFNIGDIEKFLESNFKYGQTDEEYEEENYKSKTINKSIMQINMYGHLFAIEYKPNKSLILKYPEESLEFIKSEIMPILSVLMAKTPFLSYQYKKNKDNKIVGGCATEWNVENEKERFETILEHKNTKIELISISNHRGSIHEMKNPFKSIQFPEISEKKYLIDGIKKLSNPALNYLLNKYDTNNDLSMDVKNERMNFVYEKLKTQKPNLNKTEDLPKLGITPEPNAIYPGDIPFIGETAAKEGTQSTSEKQRKIINSIINQNDSPQLGVKHIISSEKRILPKTTENYEIDDAKLSNKDVASIDAEPTQQKEDINQVVAPTTTIKDDKSVGKNESKNIEDNIISTSVLTESKTPAYFHNQGAPSFERITTFELNDTDLSDSFSIEETKIIVSHIEPYIRDNASERSKFLFYKVNGEAGSSLYGFNYNAQNSDERGNKYLGKISKIELNEQTGEAKIYYSPTLEKDNFTPIVRQFSPEYIKDLNILMKKIQAKKHISVTSQNDKITKPIEKENVQTVEDVGNPTITASGDSDDTVAAPVSTLTGNEPIAQNEISPTNSLPTVENLQALKVIESTSALIRLWKEQGESIPSEFIKIYEDACKTILNQSYNIINDRDTHGITTIGEGNVVFNVYGNGNNIYYNPDSMEKKTNHRQNQNLTM